MDLDCWTRRSVIDEEGSPKYWGLYAYILSKKFIKKY